MAEQIPPAYQAGGCYTAQQDRQMWSSLICEEGVRDLDGGDLAVTAPGGMNVEVADGSAWIQGDSVADQGMYYVVNDAPVILPVGPPDPTDSRIDLVVATVRDAEYAGTDNDWLLQVIAGTPSPTPVAPALPDSSIPLARISIPAGTSELTVASLTDLREQYGICSGSIKAGLSNMIVYSASSTFVKANHPDARSLRIRVVGGGGGGGGAQATTAGNSSGGSGGGAGAYAESLVPIDTVPASVTVTVGTGGNGGGTQGGNGGTSSFGALVSAGGGVGGTRLDNGSGADATTGSAGGTSGTGQIFCVGDDSSAGIRLGGATVLSGAGGTSPGIGAAGGRSRSGQGDGDPGNAPGGGGGGATSRGGGSAQSGGVGGNGIVVVEIYT